MANRNRARGFQENDCTFIKNFYDRKNVFSKLTSSIWPRRLPAIQRELRIPHVLFISLK